MVVFYEHVCLSPGEVLDDLSWFLGVSLPKAALERPDKVSWSSSTDIGSMSDSVKISRWKGDLDEEQKGQVANVLAASDLDEFYSLESEPVATGARPSNIFTTIKFYG